MRPDAMATLDAIDATLAGEPVDPEYAEVAELALLLQAERSEPSPEFAARLDERAARRFEAERPRRRTSPRWLFAPAAGLAVAVVVVAVVVVTSSGGGRRPVFATSAPSAGAPRRALSQNGAYLPPAPAPLTAIGAPATAAAPSLPGRKRVQSSQLSLSASGNHVDDIAQEVFDVIGADQGYVNSSNVTATGGPGGYAQFQLTVPSDSLSSAMTQLSELRYARVVSRTDTSNDVTNQFNAASSQLAQARALRTSLLKQLQNAVTQTQIDAIKARLADTGARISGEEAALRSLSHRIGYSRISLTVDGRSVVPLSHKSHGFTLGRAAHDAGHVLEVAAGVALIALAVLAPLGLVGALAWWAAAAARRRRREQALDLA
jgi:Domain of unknown function (DUF4349)